MNMRGFILLTLVLLASCGGKAEPVVENQYIVRYEKLSAQGQDAWHQGSYASAQTALQHALQVAWLSSDMTLVADAQYHLGILLLNQSIFDSRKVAEAEKLLLQAMENAAQSTQSGGELTEVRSNYALALLYQQQKPESAPPLKVADLPARAPGDLLLSAARLHQLRGEQEQAEKLYGEASRMGAKFYQAQGHLGLALLARDGNQIEVLQRETEKVLQLSKQAGFPLLAAHALLLQGSTLSDEKKLERAWQTYKALADRKGQRDSLQALLKLAQQAKDEHRMHQWQQALAGLKQEGSR